MGRFVNPDSSAFQVALNSKIYVDKTGLISYTNSVLDTTNAYICNSRPRRFGKSYAANMLAAYYSKGADSEKMFSGLAISRNIDFKKHLNQYDVIHIDIQQFVSKYPVIKDMVARLTKELLFDVKMEMPDVTLFDETDLVRTSKDIFSQKREKFIFIIDEWDSIFRVHRDNATASKEYLDFLRDLLKGQPYVAHAYMTGILPIKKYGQHSALNMFKE